MGLAIITMSNTAPFKASRSGVRRFAGYLQERERTMNTLTAGLCVLGLGVGSSADILMDQIGLNDGLDTGVDLLACQYFESLYSAYDIAVLDDFDGAGETIVMIEAVVDGWNGFYDLAAVTGYHLNLYTDPSAGAANLTGDIADQFIDADEAVVNLAWEGYGWDLGFNCQMLAATGTNWIAVIPVNEFASNGQTAIIDSYIGNGTNAWQVNPGGGFGIPGNMEDAGLEVAYRVHSGEPIDPCALPLPLVCHADINQDGVVDITDLLAVIDTFGASGDGTERPAGDIAPLPVGDCVVDISDVLELISSFDADCTVFGACCQSTGECTLETAENCGSADQVYWGDHSGCADAVCETAACCIASTCLDLTWEACAAFNGTYRGEGTTCADADCTNPPPGDTCDIAITAVEGENPFDTTLNFSGFTLPECFADPLFGWDVPTKDIWFAWTASETRDYIIDTCDQSSYDTALEVLSDCGGTLLGCNGDVDALLTCQPFSSSLLLSANAGDTYLIHIGGYSEYDYGSGTLNISPSIPGACCYLDGTCADSVDRAECGFYGGFFGGDGTLCSDSGMCEPPPGDHCADAIVATLEGPNVFNTVVMTPSEEPVDESLCPGTYLNWNSSGDAWLVWSATGTGTASFSTCNPNSFDTSMVLYEGSCDQLTQIACNGDADPADGACQDWYSYIADVPVASGTDYYIRIGAYDEGMAGIGSVTISFNDIGAVGACCMPDGSCSDEVSSDCGVMGGSWASSALCADADCSQPYLGCPEGADENCDSCWIDGSDPSTDCNGGPNTVPPAFQSSSLGVPVCGTLSVFSDSTGAYIRDLDWFYNTALNAGGDFTLSGGSSGMTLVVGIIDVTTYDFTHWLVIPGGTADSLAVSGLPPGLYTLIAAPADWVLDWTCGSGLENYWIMIE